MLHVRVIWGASSAAEAVAPPTRIDTGLNSSTQVYTCNAGTVYQNSIWQSEQATGSDVAGTDDLTFTRIDVEAKLYASLWQNAVSKSQTLNGTANTYDHFAGYDAGGPNSSSMTVNTLTQIITPPIGATHYYEIEYSVSWDSTTSGNKIYTFAIHTRTNGGSWTECPMSRALRALPNNDTGITTSKCVHRVLGGDTVEFELRVKSDVASVNITSYGGYMTVNQID